MPRRAAFVGRSKKGRIKDRAVSIAQEKQFSARRRTIPHLRARVRLFARHNIRNSELGLTVVAGAIGAVIALGVALARAMVSEFHHLLYGVPIEEHISGVAS